MFIVKKVRKNFMVTEDVSDYIKIMADELGISEAGFINVAISEYRKQNEAINSISLLMKQLEGFGGVKNGVEK